MRKMDASQEKKESYLSKRYAYIALHIIRKCHSMYIQHTHTYKRNKTSLQTPWTCLISTNICNCFSFILHLTARPPAHFCLHSMLPVSIHPPISHCCTYTELLAGPPPCHHSRQLSDCQGKITSCCVNIRSQRFQICRSHFPVPSTVLV